MHVEGVVVAFQRGTVEFRHLAHAVASSRAASYMLLARAKTSAAPNRAFARLITDWLSERLPLLSPQTRARPAGKNVCILRAIFRSSKPALVRESEAIQAFPCH